MQAGVREGSTAGLVEGPVGPARPGAADAGIPGDPPQVAPGPGTEAGGEELPQPKWPRQGTEDPPTRGCVGRAISRRSVGLSGPAQPRQARLLELLHGRAAAESSESGNEDK